MPADCRYAIRPPPAPHPKVNTTPQEKSRLTTIATPRPSAPTTAAAPPVWYRGTPLRAAKLFTEGTHRTRSPESTLEWIRPHFPYAGITRLADITGLDF